MLSPEADRAPLFTAMTRATTSPRLVGRVTMQIRTVPNLTPKHCPSCSWPIRKAQRPAAAVRRDSPHGAPPRWILSLAK